MIDKGWSQVKRVLAIRLDNLGDVLVTTPALHAIKTSLPAATLTLLTSPVGAQVARLNPDLDDVIVYQAPWMDPWHKLPQDSQREQQMIATIRERRFDGAIIFTSFRQSPLPAAYLCYLADISLRVAASIDGPGSLLTTRHKNPPITSDKGGIASQLPQGGIAEREQLHKNDETSRNAFKSKVGANPTGDVGSKRNQSSLRCRVRIYPARTWDPAWGQVIMHCKIGERI